MLERTLQHLLPPTLDRSDPAALRKATHGAALLSIFAFMAGFFSVVDAATGMKYTAVTDLTALSLAAFGLIAFRRTGDNRIPTYVLPMAILIGLTGIDLEIGLLSTPLQAWLMVLPIGAILMGGARAGLPWLGVVLAVVLGHPLIEDAWWMPTPSLPPEVIEGYMQVGTIALTVTMVTILSSYDLAYTRALSALDRTRREVEEMRDEARAAHAAARRVLDNVGEGLVVVSLDGRIGGEHSRALDAWVRVVPGATLWSLFEEKAPEFAEWLDLGWADLAADVLPWELVLGQLPREVELDGRHLTFAYRPLLRDGALHQVLVVISDDTARIEANAAAAAEQQLATVLLRAHDDRQGTLDFVAEATRLVGALHRGEGTPEEQKRWIHTLKGNTAMFGMTQLSRWLHDLESRIAEGSCSEQDLAQLASHWTWFEQRIGPWLAEARNAILIERAAYDELLEQLQRGVAPARIVEDVQKWPWEAVAHRLDRLAERVRTIATAAGKGEVEVRVDASDARYPPTAGWKSFWSALVHVVRNAIDHGVETASAREARGRKGRAQIRLCARDERDRLVIEVADDGPGIDWGGLAARAAAHGLPAATRDDLVDALWRDGISSHAEATELGGRGVGLAAVRQACEQIGGRVEVHSLPAEGTRFSFHFVTGPHPQQVTRAAASR